MLMMFWSMEMKGIKIAKKGVSSTIILAIDTMNTRTILKGLESICRNEIKV